jgi:hypothetical protein
MGLDPNGVKFLLYARSLGIDFARSAMIGRQSLHLSPLDLQGILSLFSLPAAEATVTGIFKDHAGYAEGLLHHLGASQVHSFDYSAFEGATHLHDMNQPIADEFKGRYTTVIDAGSLEHVFNFPTAIKNCMEMLAVGGHYVGITPANNYFGHGFYQFSAETFFRVFSEDQGFETRAVILFEDLGTRWYAVKDPQQVGKRVILVNYRRTQLAVLARRIADRPVFATMPQQTDYAMRWEQNPKDTAPMSAPPKRSPGLVAMINRYMPTGLKRSLKKTVFSIFGIRAPEDFPEFFHPIDIGSPPKQRG